MYMIMKHMHNHELIALRGVSRMFLNIANRLLATRGYTDTNQALVVDIRGMQKYTTTHIDGNLVYSSRDAEQKIHSDIGPAQIVINKNGYLKSMSWYQHGALHRSNGPAMIVYHMNSKIIKEESWYYHNKLHKHVGYARTINNTKGQPITREKYNMGRLTSTCT